MDLLSYRTPKTNAFKNKSGDWLEFRRLRFAQAGDGHFIVMRDLDLSDSDLRDFPADHTAFVRCNLNNAIFSGMRVAYATTFIDCSMKHTDFNNTTASDALFMHCDLSDAQFPAGEGWATVNLDGATDYSIFLNCTLPTTIDRYLIKDGNITDSSKLTPRQQISLYENICERLGRIITAPIVEV